ncbi:hypothetical protein [Magnetococcus sp. PR-3]|uniref:hypothetical protein n=1 Tax=Magnetococcus sp. PR-3 TaxID=3120355 RepID=UPI002FCDF566
MSDQTLLQPDAEHQLQDDEGLDRAPPDQAVGDGESSTQGMESHDVEVGEELSHLAGSHEEVPQADLGSQQSVEGGTPPSSPQGEPHQDEETFQPEQPVEGGTPPSSAPDEDQVGGSGQVSGKPMLTDRQRWFEIFKYYALCLGGIGVIHQIVRWSIHLFSGKSLEGKERTAAAETVEKSGTVAEAPMVDTGQDAVLSDGGGVVSPGTWLDQSMTFFQQDLIFLCMLTLLYLMMRKKLIEIRRLYALAGVPFVETPMFLIASFGTAAIVLAQISENITPLREILSFIPQLNDHVLGFFYVFAAVQIFHFVDFFRIDGTISRLMRQEGLVSSITFTGRWISFQQELGLDPREDKRPNIQVDGAMDTQEMTPETRRQVCLDRRKEMKEKNAIKDVVSEWPRSRFRPLEHDQILDRGIPLFMRAELLTKMGENLSYFEESIQPLRSVFGNIANLYHPDYLPHLSHLYLKISQMRGLNVPPRRIQLLNRTWSKRGLVSEYVLVHNISELRSDYLEGQDWDKYLHDLAVHLSLPSFAHKPGEETSLEQVDRFVKELKNLDYQPKWRQRSLKKRALVTVAPDGGLLEIAIEEERQINI